jgi:hypothetical protein
MPQVSFELLQIVNYYKSLLFHGGDTGSIPVRDASKIDTPRLTVALTFMILDQLA